MARSKQTRKAAPIGVKGQLSELTDKDLEKAVGRACTERILEVDTTGVLPGTREYSRRIVEGLHAFVDKAEAEGRSPLQAMLDSMANLVFGGLLEAEMEEHLGYGRYERTPAQEGAERGSEGPERGSGEALEGEGGTPRKNCRNGSYKRRVRTKDGDMRYDHPRDRSGQFVSKIMPRGHRLDLTDKDVGILEMVARGNSTRDIAAMIKAMFGIDISHEYVQGVIERYQEKLRDWQQRELQPFYPFIFIDCTYVPLRGEDKVARKRPVYVILGIDIHGKKELLDIEVRGDVESKQEWMNIFDQLSRRGVQDVLFVCMDGITGVGEGVKTIFPKAITQRCIVHLVRNSCNYINFKDRKEWCADVKPIYASPDLATARAALENLIEKWKGKTSCGVRFWSQHFENDVAPLYAYPSAIRNVIYTTNAIESVNSSLKETVKKGCFTSAENVLITMLLRSEKVLSTNWKRRAIKGWATIYDQLYNHETTSEVMHKYTEIK